MRYYIYGMLAACLLLTACHGSSATSSSTSLRQKGDTIVVPQSSPVHSSLEQSAIVPTLFASNFSAVGSVRAEAGKMAEVAAPMDGRTGRAFIHIGSQVRAGQPLFSFRSAEFSDIVKSWYEARSNNALAARNLARKRSLKDDEVISEREWEEVQNEAEMAHRALQQVEQTLSILGMDTARLLSNGQMHVIAPISGEVIRCEVTNGQFVHSDDPSLVTIADLSCVWVTAQIKEQYIRFVHSNDSVSIFSDAFPDKHFSGRIIYIGSIVDEQTRAIDVTIRLENPLRELKPGMFVQTTFTGQQAPALLIPASAVMQGQTPFVYLALNDSTFIPQEVKIRSVSTEQVEVLSGLEGNERIITKGGFYLAQ